MSDLEQRVLKALPETRGTSLWESLIGLVTSDREGFFRLACEGVSPTAQPRLAELAELAKQVRTAVRGSYQIDVTAEGAHLVGPRLARTFIPINLVDQVKSLLSSIDGKGIQATSGKDYEGTAISEAEVRFQLGEPATWGIDRDRIRQRNETEPLILQVDAVDLVHLAMQPAYVSFQLKECARRTVLAPMQVYRDLRRGDGCQENLDGALAFCGNPRRAVNNQGHFVAAPSDMAFAVFADKDGFVFDWDWILTDRHAPDYPEDDCMRFGDPIPWERDAILMLPEDLPVPTFDRTQACYSPRGDCIFCYITDDVAYACRINPDLTVFRSLSDRQKITGFKIKNVRRILERDKDITLDNDPDLVVTVQSALLATLKWHRDAQVSVYNVLIAAITKDPEPPTVRVPKRPVGRPVDNREPVLA